MMLKACLLIGLLGHVTAKQWCCDPPTTRDAKLDLHLKDNNHDGDKFVSAADINYDLTENYDENKDGDVTVYEAVKRWNCRYGDSYEFAEWVFRGLTGGKDILNIASFKGPANPGIPLAAFRAMNANRYVTYANILKSNHSGT